MFKIICSSAFLFLAGCASIQSVSLTPIPKDRSREVRAEVSKTVFLAFSFNNDFVEPLVDELKQKCPQGVVTGILTKDEVIHYFIAHTRKVVATGYCVVGKVAAAPAAASPVKGRTR